MGYRVRRIDQNQTLIVERFRGLGCHVLILSEVGHGCPDILVGLPRPGTHGWLALVEIKDGTKPPSHRKLTPDEEKFHVKWDGFVYIIKSLEEVDQLVAWARGLR